MATVLDEPLTAREKLYRFLHRRFGTAEALRAAPAIADWLIRKWKLPRPKYQS